MPATPAGRRLRDHRPRPGGDRRRDRRAVRRQVLAERDGKVWPGFEEEAIFELSLERCLLMLTQPDSGFPAGPTIWTATAGREAHPDIVV